MNNKTLFFTILVTFILCSEGAKKEVDFTNQLSFRVIYGDTFEKYETFSLNQSSKMLNSKGYDASKPSIFYFHGWSEDPDSESVKTIMQAYLYLKKYNLIIFDYRNLVKRTISSKIEVHDSEREIIEFLSKIFEGTDTALAYKESTINATIIGRNIGSQISALVKDGLDKKKIHLIGHSLGGQIVGVVGKQFYDLRKEKLPRITALDPAGPFYYKNPDRLTPETATFVDVVHTDYWIGYYEPTGRADFYGNTLVPDQPGCASENNSLASEFSEVICNHQRSWHYYAESIYNPRAFPSVQCGTREMLALHKCVNNEIEYMGYMVTERAQGNYFFTTNNKPPYGRWSSDFFRYVMKI